MNDLGVGWSMLGGRGDTLPVVRYALEDAPAVSSLSRRPSESLSFRVVAHFSHHFTWNDSPSSEWHAMFGLGPVYPIRVTP